MSTALKTDRYESVIDYRSQSLEACSTNHDEAPTRSGRDDNTVERKPELSLRDAGLVAAPAAFGE